MIVFLVFIVLIVPLLMLLDEEMYKIGKLIENEEIQMNKDDV